MNTNIEDLSNEDGINAFLQRILDEIEFEASIKYDHILFLGNDVRKAILNKEELLGKGDQTLLKEAFCQAVDILSQKVTSEPLENFSSELKIFMRTLREAFLNGVSKMQKSHKDSDILESLNAFTNFSFNRVVKGSEKVPCLRFLAYSIMALSEDIRPFRIEKK